jgi:hypothetical protein
VSEISISARLRFLLRLPVPQDFAEDDGVGEINALMIYIGEEHIVEAEELNCVPMIFLEATKGWLAE